MAAKKMIHLEVDIYPPYTGLGTFTFIGSSGDKSEPGVFFTSKALNLKNNYKITVLDHGAFKYDVIHPSKEEEKPKRTRRKKQEDEEDE